MRSLVLFAADTPARLVAKGSAAHIRRALAASKEKVDTFTTMIPWPALAASFQRDVDTLEAALAKPARGR